MLSARLGLPEPSDLLLQALTHPSFAHEHPPAGHNETLAFLGDANLMKSFLQGADLRDTDLGAVDLRLAVADKRTRWPVGFDWRRAGAALAP